MEPVYHGDVEGNYILLYAGSNTVIIILNNILEKYKDRIIKMGWWRWLLSELLYWVLFFYILVLKISLMTENNKHISEDISDEEIQKIAEYTWNIFIKMLNDDPDDKAYLEKVEVVERWLNLKRLKL